MLADLFRRNGWQVKANPKSGLEWRIRSFSEATTRYVAELKVFSEGRRDRLVPVGIQYTLIWLHRWLVNVACFWIQR